MVVGFAYKVVAVALCLVASVLVGCSQESPNDPYRGPSAEGDSRGSGAGAPSGGDDAGEGSGEDGSHVTIRNAVLSTAGDTRRIDAQVSYGGPGVWPQCFLVDGPTMAAIKRYQEGGRGRPKERIVSRWAQPDSGEKMLLEDGTLLWTFVEDEYAKEETPDPKRTPYFVICPGGQGAEIYDEAHVEGTPEPSS